MQNTPAPMNGPRYDEFITVPKVRVIDQDGENLGVLYTKEAIATAHEVGLNLVEVSPGADPPVCKILDVGKFKYEAQKKAAAARKNQKTQEIKEIKMRPNIDDHDYDTKMKAVQRFIEEGDKVKLTLRFRGRELSHGELGLALLERVRDDAVDYAKVEQLPVVAQSTFDDIHVAHEARLIDPQSAHDDFRRMALPSRQAG